MPKIKLSGHVYIEEISEVSQEDYQLVMDRLEEHNKAFENQIKREMFANDNDVKVESKIRIEVLD